MKKKSVAAYIDLIVCSIVVVIGFIGTKIILFDLLDGTFNKEFNDIGIVMVTVFILSTVVFGMQIPKTIKEVKNNYITNHLETRGKIFCKRLVYLGIYQYLNKTESPFS